MSRPSVPTASFTTRVLAAASLLALSCAARVRPTTELSWLEGSWWSDDGAIGERWESDGRGGLRGLGLSRGEEGIEVSEELELVRRDGHWIYVATPREQARTEFVVTERTEERFVAENPEHDFPTRLEYRREGDRVYVRVSSPTRGFELELVRR